MTATRVLSPADRLAALRIRTQALAFVQRELGIGPVDLCSQRRQPPLVSARALFVAIVKTHGPVRLSYAQIGRWLGNRDHSTIQYEWKVKASLLRERDPGFVQLCSKFAALAAHHQEAA